MSRKDTIVEFWLRNYRFRIAIDRYPDSNWAFRSLDGGLRRCRKRFRSFGRYSIDFWKFALKLEDYGQTR